MGSRTVMVVPSPGDGAHIEPAVVQIDQSLDDGQAEPRALIAAGQAVLGLEERLADALDGLRRHADAAGRQRSGSGRRPDASSRR